MESVTRSAEGAALVVGLDSGVVEVEGERLELPVKELRLLAELAQRPGEVLSSADLMAAVWPETPWMTAQDLYWHMSQLRRHLGGSERARKLIRNRRGFGYLLDLEAGEVVIHRQASPPDDDTIWLDEPFEQAEAQPLEIPTRRSIDLSRVAISAALILLLLGASWSAGFLISKWRSTRAVEQPPSQALPQRPEEDVEQQETKPDRKPKSDREKRKQRTPGKSEQRVSRAPVNPPSAQQPPPVTSAGTSSSSSEADRPKNRPKPAPPLPPAPTRYLYHLINSDTGDHLVTTDGGIASEYEAQGYSGGAIARIYTYGEKDTKAIATDHGTAYVFINSAAKTKPASQTTPLWYATNNAGDFFYSTSEAEASGSGWSATLIGYVRTPS